MLNKWTLGRFFYNFKYPLPSIFKNLKTPPPPWTFNFCASMHSAVKRRNTAATIFFQHKQTLISKFFEFLLIV